MTTPRAITAMIRGLLTTAGVIEHVKSIGTLEATDNRPGARTVWTTYVLTKNTTAREIVLDVLRECDGIGTVEPGHLHVYVTRPVEE